jgi:hypothetical protein
MLIVLISFHFIISVKKTANDLQPKPKVHQIAIAVLFKMERFQVYKLQIYLKKQIIHSRKINAFEWHSSTSFKRNTHFKKHGKNTDKFHEDEE